MQYGSMLAERSKFKEYVLFSSIGVACGFLFLISTGLSTTWALLCLSAIVIPFTAILTGSTTRVFLGLLILCIPFNVDKNFFLHPEHTGGAVGLSISIWEISLLFLVAIWISQTLFNKEQEIHLLPKWSIPFFCLIGFSLLSIVKSSDIELSIFEIIQLIKVFLLFFYIANYIKTEEQLRYVILILFLTFFLENILGLFQYFSGRSFDLAIFGGGEEKFATRFGTGSPLRISGTFGTSNGFGSYLIMILPLLISLVLFTEKRALKLVYSSLFIAGVISLILTLSRGAWVAFAASVAVVLFLTVAKRESNLKTIFVGGLVLITSVIVIFTFSETILLRFYADDHGSALSRITMMRTAFEIIKANPFFGVGLNTYCEAMQNYDSSGLASVYLQPVHNVYLQLAAEIGIFGFAVLLWFIFLLYREGLRDLKKRSDFVSSVRIGLVGGITALLLHSMVNNGSLGDDIFILFWLLAGLLVATIRISSRIDK